MRYGLLMLLLLSVGCGPTPTVEVPSPEVVIEPEPKPVETESAKAGNVPTPELGFSAKVIDVGDGDTITVLNDKLEQIKIRMAQIDAPEKKQAYGEKSRQALRDMIAGKQVRVVSDEKDKYDRTIADIYDGDQWINLAMIRDGWAWHYKRFSDDTALAQAETVAQSLKRGLWADNGVPMAPWEWRNPPNLPGYFAQGKGKKFHTGKCSTLDSRRRQVEGNEIEALGLEPCKVCKPH